MEIKRVRNFEEQEEEEDLISALPDSLLHHILSFLPSTIEVIQTGILSKRWLNQWTHVSVLIFNFFGTYSDFSDEDISDFYRFIDNTLILHDCSKIQKFHIKSNLYNFTMDSNCDAKLRFAIRKGAEELILRFDCIDKVMLPNFFFSNGSLVKLQMKTLILMPNGRVNWECLKDLCVDSCWWPNEAIESVVSGSPLLESLEINSCEGFDRLVIASKSLKRLVLVNFFDKFVLEISCPNLVGFSVVKREIIRPFHLPDGAVENVLSSSPLLELLEVRKCEGFEQLVVDSNSLKKLVLVGIETNAVVISCPNLEELNLSSLFMKTIELTNLPQSICATLDFDCSLEWYDENSCPEWYGETLGRTTLEQLHHVKELKFGLCFIKSLSGLEMRGIPSPSVNIKCLTFDVGSDFVEHFPGIAYALRSSPELEKLVIALRLSECLTSEDEDTPDSNVYGENYWNSNETVFNCLTSHLKIVKITGLSEKDVKLGRVLNFVEFLLKNARVLEKMLVVLEDRTPDFVFEVSQKLLDLPRYSQHAIVELL